MASQSPQHLREKRCKKALQQSDRQTYETLLEALKSARLKLTETRKAILKRMSGPHHAWTIEELFQTLNKKTNQTHDWSTIYRCLKKFEEIGLVTLFDLGDGQIRYELRDEHGHHHHIICRECQDTTPIEDCNIAPLEKAIAKKGFRDLSHRLDFFGICPGCQTSA